jgi:hypothetical protein
MDERSGLYKKDDFFLPTKDKARGSGSGGDERKK